jgi:hypothetical protein
MGENGPKSLFSNLPQADMLMPVQMGSQASPAVIEVDEMQALHPYARFKLVQGQLQSLAALKFIACGMEVAGVEAHTQPLFFSCQGIQDSGYILKAAAHAVPGPGAVLQKEHSLATATIQSDLESSDYPLQTGLSSRSEMASQMGDQVGQAQGTASFQLHSQRLDRFGVNLISG